MGQRAHRGGASASRASLCCTTSGGLGHDGPALPGPGYRKRRAGCCLGSPLSDSASAEPFLAIPFSSTFLPTMKWSVCMTFCWRRQQLSCSFLGCRILVLPFPGPCPWTGHATCLWATVFASRSLAPNRSGRDSWSTTGDVATASPRVSSHVTHPSSRLFCRDSDAQCPRSFVALCYRTLVCCFGAGIWTLFGSVWVVCRTPHTSPCRRPRACPAEGRVEWPLLAASSGRESPLVEEEAVSAGLSWDLLEAASEACRSCKPWTGLGSSPWESCCRNRRKLRKPGELRVRRAAFWAAVFACRDPVGIPE